MTTLLLDGDIIAYKMASAVERSIDWGDGTWSLNANIDEAKDGVKRYIEGLMKKLGGTKIWVCLTDAHNFRKDIFPDYKANRKDVRRPLVLDALKGWMKEFYPSKIFDGVEADDVLGILATLHKDTKPVIVSEDKDLRQIPGLLFNPEKDEKPVEISGAEADWFFFLQVLAGDSTDNYKGCPGIGMETAAVFLRSRHIWYRVDRQMKSGPRKGQTLSEWKQRDMTESETIWDAIVSCYAKAGLTEDDALLQARVARILRSEDYDVKKMKLKLWEPK